MRANYLNEDSFFVPPDFDKDPQTDWPLIDAGGQNGGYTEGCCDGAGFLSIPEKGGGGVRVNHSAGVDADGNPPAGISGKATSIGTTCFRVSS